MKTVEVFGKEVPCTIESLLEEIGRAENGLLSLQATISRVKKDFPDSYDEIIGKELHIQKIRDGGKKRFTNSDFLNAFDKSPLGNGVFTEALNHPIQSSAADQAILEFHRQQMQDMHIKNILPRLSQNIQDSYSEAVAVPKELFDPKYDCSVWEDITNSVEMDPVQYVLKGRTVLYKKDKIKGIFKPNIQIKVSALCCPQTGTWCLECYVWYPGSYLKETLDHRRFEFPRKWPSEDHQLTAKEIQDVFTRLEDMGVMKLI